MTPRSAFRLCLALVFSLLAPAAPVRADDAEQSAALCERAILNGARRGGVPPEILYAVALTETGRKTGDRVRPYPWAINREGKGHWFETREEALAFGQQSLLDGRKSFDVGCVQINYRWHGHAFPSLDDMFDPEWTATYAAQFLRTLYEERGDWSAAAGAYHSLTPELSNIYRTRFDRLLASLEPGALTETEALMATAAPDQRFSSRQERRAAQRRAAAERIANAGPPPETVMGSMAARAFAPGAGLFASSGAPLLTEGRPMLVAPAGSLF